MCVHLKRLLFAADADESSLYSRRSLPYTVHNSVGDFLSSSSLYNSPSIMIEQRTASGIWSGARGSLVIGEKSKRTVHIIIEKRDSCVPR